MDRVRVGVIGAGPWGNNLVRCVAESEAGDLVAVCEADASLRRRLAGRFPNARIVGGLDDLLAVGGVDAVVIATPASLHFGHARRALLAGKHVLVEKPLCTNTADAAELCRLAEAGGRVLLVGHTYLYNNLVHEVKRRIESGQLGRVRYLCSRRLNLGRVRTDVDALWNLAPHDVSIACCLLDGLPKSVSAYGWSYLQTERNIADVCFYQMEFEDGVAAAGHVSWLDPQKERTTVVVGSERMLVYDDMNASRHLQVYDRGVEMQFQAPLNAYSDFAARVRSGDLNIPNVRMVEPLAVETAHFLDCIRTGQRPRTDGWAGLDILCILETMSRSMSDGGRMLPVRYIGGRPGALRPPDHDALARTLHAATKDLEETPKEKARWARSPSTTLAPSTEV